MMKAKKEAELEGFAKEFVTNNLSAAGVSYIVNSKSFIRRFLWFVGIIICMIFMAYMTLNVIMEYLSYPKMLIKEDVILPKLAFPAVTICSLNPISRQLVDQTSLKTMLDIRELLEKTSKVEHDEVHKKNCYDNPLCQWSFFREQCSCIDSPCLTEFCLAENFTHCGCSNIFCSNHKHSSCQKVFSEDGDKLSSCVCEGPSSKEPSPADETNAVNERLLSLIKEPHLRESVRIIRHSKTFDLVDVDEALMPKAEELLHYGITFDNLVAACSFEGEYCYRENFSVLFHPNYGKCYMFNYVGRDLPESEKPIESLRYGSTSGLQLILRVEDNMVLDLLRREIGARIVVHDPHALPFVSEFGVNVRPHDMTAVELSLSKMQRLDSPWGECQEKVYNTDDDEPYSILGCEKRCGLKYMLDKCNCTMRHLLHGSIFTRKHLPFPLCDFNNSTQRNCALQSSADIERHSSDCNCIPPCSETIYSYTVASSKLNENFFKTVKALHTLKLDNDTEEMEYVHYSDEKSLLGVKVYYNAFMVSNHKEVASYSWETMVANIGGNLGFFMGLTVVTFFEITEFIWDFVSMVCGRLPATRINAAKKMDRKMSTCNRIGAQQKKIRTFSL